MHFELKLKLIFKRSNGRNGNSILILSVHRDDDDDGVAIGENKKGAVAEGGGERAAS